MCNILWGGIVMTMKKPYCKKRNEILPIGKNMPEDYCVDCEYFNTGDCFAADLREILFILLNRLPKF